MKAIKCEMCNSSDIVKDGDFFVCQSCGTKYTTEAAKKLMVEGTVKIDSSEELMNLYLLARRAASSGNTEKAQQYYEQIVVKAPDDWEASYYSVYYQCTNCTVGQLEQAAHQLRYTGETIITNIAGSDMTAEEKHDAILQIVNCSILFASMVRTNVKNNEYILTIGENTRNMTAAYEMLNGIGIIIEMIYNNKDKNPSVANIPVGLFINCWESAINLEHDMIYWFITATESRRKHRDHMEIMANKIRKYNPSYKAPEVYIAGETKGKGCYVATCVYGSYDCPQVWTLRRFRDDTLGSTWYGRAFIRFYYAVSPTLVKWFGKTKWFKKLWRGKLDRMVRRLNEKGVKDTPYQDKQW